MIIIDPDKLGCTVWCNDKVQQLKGSPYECCMKIVGYLLSIGAMSKNEKTKVMYNFDAVRMLSDYTMHIEILIDTKGIGHAYKEFFQDKNILYTEVKAKKFIE